MAKFIPILNEFRIYTTNAQKNPTMFQEDSHIAKVIFNRKKKQFIIKNKYCLSCTKRGDYYCESSKKWLFQQELGYYYIVRIINVITIEREEDIAPKTYIKYTFAYLCFPMIKPTYEITPWCPRALQLKENRTFSMYDGKPDKMHEVLNDEQFRGSLKDAYEQKSMDKTRSDDRLLMRAKRPYFKKIERSLSLNFGGRVKKASRKNIQIVIVSDYNSLGIQIQERR